VNVGVCPIYAQAVVHTAGASVAGYYVGTSVYFAAVASFDYRARIALAAAALVILAATGVFVDLVLSLGPRSTGHSSPRVLLPHFASSADHTKQQGAAPHAATDVAPLLQGGFRVAQDLTLLRRRSSVLESGRQSSSKMDLNGSADKIPGYQLSPSTPRLESQRSPSTAEPASHLSPNNAGGRGLNKNKQFANCLDFRGGVAVFLPSYTLGA
jgi:hypothetical protein